MVNMHVHAVFSEGSFGVVHVVGGINLVVLSLSIVNFEGIVGRDLAVLTEVGTDKGRVSLGSIIV